MERRSFLGMTAPAALGSAGCRGRDGKPGVIDNGGGAGNGGRTLAGMSIAELRETYRSWLHDRYMPFFRAHMVDYGRGGFYPYTGRDGSNMSDEHQSVWWLGRGIWMVSFYCRAFGADERLLDVARKGVEVLDRTRPVDDGFRPSPLTRDGSPAAQQAPSLYDDMFAAEGLAAFAAATGEDRWWDLARDTVLRCMRRYDDPEYRYPSPAGIVPRIENPRIIGHWMVFLNTTTAMLAERDDPALRAVSDRAVEAILDYHMNPAFDLLNEYIAHDMSPPDGPLARYCYPGHGYETLWMVMTEAVRRGDDSLFDRAAAAFRRHVAVSHDDVYGGVFRELRDVDANTWTTAKSTWAQVEVLVGAMLLFERTGDPWAEEMYGRMHRYFDGNYSLADEGCPMWLLGGDRTLESVRPRVGDTYHIPRWLMLNLLHLDRMA